LDTVTEIRETPEPIPNSEVKPNFVGSSTVVREPTGNVSTVSIYSFTELNASVWEDLFGVLILSGEQLV